MGANEPPIMPQGKSALVKTAKSRSAIQKKKDNQKIASKKKKLKSKIGGVISVDHKSTLLTQRGQDKASTAITKGIQRRIVDEVHSRAAKRGSAFGVVKSSDQDNK